MRADSQASKPFTAQKVMLTGDSCCHQADVFLVAYITPQQASHGGAEAAAEGCAERCKY